MILIHQLLDYATPWSLPNVYLFTGNGIVRKDGGIVMGRGAARQVRDLYPSVQYILGRSITKKPLAKIMFGTIGKAQWIGWFKVKYHWGDPADPW